MAERRGASRPLNSSQLDGDVEDDCAPSSARPMDISSTTCYNFDNYSNLVQKTFKGNIITTTCDSGFENDMDFDSDSLSLTQQKSISHSANTFCTDFTRLAVSESSATNIYLPNNHTSEHAKDNFDSGFSSGDRLSGLESQVRICQEETDAIVRNENQTDSFTYEQRILYEQDEDGDTQLHMAIIQMVPAMTLLIILKAPNTAAINLKNLLRQTALHLSVIINQSETTKNLLAAGAQLDCPDHKGNTALHIACKEGYPLCVEALTTPVDSKDITCTYPVPAQSIPQDLEMVNYEGKTCLHLAAENYIQNRENDSFRRIISHLVNIGANINKPDGKSGRTILHYCAEFGSKELLSVILEHPTVNLDATTYAGKTALMLAIGRGFADLAQVLVNAGAQPPPQGHDDRDSSEDMSEDSEDSDSEYNDICIYGQPVSKT